jgi:D-inositol-3-phosphate glycosyltransferase
MRIVFLSPHSDPLANLGEPDAGGQCVYENELAIALAQNGIEVKTFCRQRNEHEIVTQVVPGYTVYRIRAGGMGFVPKENIERTLPEFTSKVHQILSALEPDPETILHAHYWDGVASALIYKSHYPDYQMVWTPHSLGFTKRDNFKGIKSEMVYHFIARLAWENYGSTVANSLIVSTSDEKRRLVRNYGVVPKRVAIIPPGVTIGSTEFASQYREAWHLPPESKLLLTIGRISRIKGYHHAIHILHELDIRSPGKYRLAIVGGASHVSSPEEEKYFYDLHRLVNKYGLQDKVIFQPSVPHHEIQSIYSLADFYMMTSEEEPFGLTTIEAMASGVPVIAHANGGTRNIITNNVTGYFVNMHRYREVAEYILRLDKNPLKLRRLGERAQARVREQYSWESRLPSFISIYQHVANILPDRLARIIRTDVFLQRNLNFV